MKDYLEITKSKCEGGCSEGRFHSGRGSQMTHSCLLVENSLCCVNCQLQASDFLSRTGCALVILSARLARLAHHNR